MRSNPTVASVTCGIIPVIGTVVAVGPVELAPDDTTYSYVVIEKEDGTVRDFAMVHAIHPVSGLVEHDAAGMFVFLDGPDECRLVFVYRDTGARHADCEALNFYFDATAA